MADSRTCGACGAEVPADALPVPARHPIVDVDLGDGTVANARPVRVEIIAVPRGLVPVGGPELCDGCIGRAVVKAAEALAAPVARDS